MLLLILPLLMTSYLSCIIVLIMLIWFNTDLVIDLLGFFYSYKWKYDYNMEKLKICPSFINYPTYLHIKYNNLFTKLLSCRLCFSFWSSVLLCTGMCILFFNPFIILFIPPLCILSLIIYGIISFLVKLPS